MTILSESEKNEILAKLTDDITIAFERAAAFANEHGIYWEFDMDYATYRPLDSWEAEELGMEEGQYAWVSSSTFC